MVKRKTRKEGQSYTDDYKQQVLEQKRTSDKSVAQICKELELTDSMVRKWIAADKQNNGITTQNSLSETGQQELERLRSENKKLKTERDILKKATAFFVKESQ